MVSPIQTSIKRALSPEVTVVDQEAITETKKPRLSSAGADKDKVNVGNVTTRSTTAASASVGPKPTEPTISASLRANLSVPVASTSATSGDTTALKKEFVDALPDDLKQLLEMEIETMGDDWFVALRGEFIKPYFKEDDGQAHGLAFSVRKGVRTPPSLRNIYKEIGEEIGEFKAPAHGHLTSWARQGVLLLNTCLTVRAHEAASHSKKGWETFTTVVLKTIVDRLAPTGAEQGAKGVVFLAWGAPAGKLCTGISEKSHHVLRSAHPSPLAASRGFFGNGHFVKCNEWLEETYGAGQGIDWTSVMRD
ncbi:hypothetical protein QFC20_003285 [Naganishia adeliensis]|uniref:Uncharacterized protein n=1 Tax=Naganishia adeliensis TaxID=92952 RepID=A0ACC2WFC0_9TREE|nr:hypothetical protein QFC20_003285 [Naganishia adeliensis]